MSEETGVAALIDMEPRRADFEGDILRGLSRRPRRIPSQYLYDAAGADLFEEICRQPEYYPTRTEISIMQAAVDEMAARIGPDAAIIEPGSGDGVKTQLLLEALESPALFAPVDIAREQLVRVAGELAQRYPTVPILPICADFTRDFDAEELDADDANRKVVYFPGSTIGNFTPAKRRRLLNVFRRAAGDSGGLLIGVDLRKDRRTLESAYDDAAGVTATFNTNLLRRINRELGGDLDVESFDYRAFWCERRSRVEMSQVSRAAQTATVAGRAFEFAPDEAILTECSYKFTVDGFADEAARAGWRRERVWLDDDERFAVMLCSAA